MAHSGINIIFEGANFARLMGGLWVTIRVALISIAIGGVLGILLGVLRTFHNRLLRFILRLYLEFFRIIPTVALLFLFYYILPKDMHLNLPAEEVAVIVFTLWMAAEASDIVRGALESVPQHQIESGLAIGLSRNQLYRFVLVPQSIKLMMPALINLVTRIIKTTSLLLMISVLDVINVGQQIIEANQQQYPQGAFWIYGAIFFLYFIICYPFSLLAKRLQRNK